MYLPIRDRIAISPKFESDKIATEDKSVILYKHASYKRRTTQGIVKAVGPEVTENILIGDYVFYSAYDGTLFYDGGEILIIMPEDSIKAKLVNIPDTSVRNLYILGKLDNEKNLRRLRELWENYQHYAGDLIPTTPGFLEFISDKIDAYGRHFEAPYDKAIELILETAKESDWGRGIEVGGTIQESRPDLFDDNKRTCEYCGGMMHLLRDRSTTTVFYKCSQCGKVKDRKTIKDVTVLGNG